MQTFFTHILTSQEFLLLCGFVRANETDLFTTFSVNLLIVIAVIIPISVIVYSNIPSKLFLTNKKDKLQYKRK